MSSLASIPHTQEYASSRSSVLLGIPLYVYVCVFASLNIFVGVLWDISWHMTIGRDGLFSAPHVLMYLGSVFAGIFAGFQCLKTSFWGSPQEKGRSVRFWGIFYSSLGGLFCIWGSMAALTSAPFDDWWHAAYGLDVEIFTPPHTVLLMGLITIQLGAMFVVMSMLNRAEPVAGFTAEQNASRSRRLQLMFMISAGLLISLVYLFTSEFLSSSSGHRSFYYQISAFVFPLLIFSTGRASGHRWGRTIISSLYMAFMLVVNWVMQQFHAEPLLGPILNPVTHFQFYGFPILVIVPAFFCDWLSPRLANRNDWIQALALGLVFSLVYFVTQWYATEFLFTSPLARNKIFGSYTWYFGSDPNWQYRYAYRPWSSQKLPDLLQGLGIALLIAIVTTRLALLWGKWMQRVVR